MTTKTVENGRELVAAGNKRPSALEARGEWTVEQKELIKATVAKGTTDDEFKLFLYTCKHTGLDPLLKQIHAVKRWDAALQREAMAIQVGIDGYRLMADRTGHYAPGREPTFEYKPDSSLKSATAYVKKRTEDGTWHEVGATAFYDEYVQTRKDKTPNSMWQKMQHGQLAKCAEALGLRKAFPAETSGTHSDEEMQQADSEVLDTRTGEVTKARIPAATTRPPMDDASDAQEPAEESIPGQRLAGGTISSKQISAFWAACYKNKGAKCAPTVEAYLQTLDIQAVGDIPLDRYDEVMAWAEKK